MNVLLVHPSPLMFAEVYLRLEPLGLERVASALRHAGHDVRILDLQVFSHDDYFKLLHAFSPHAVGFSLNYLANIPEVLDLAKATRQLLPGGALIFAGGHSVSFVADEVLDHAHGDIDVILRGEGETATPLLLAAAPDGPTALDQVPGIVTTRGRGPAPLMLQNLDDFPPARDLTLRRHKYFIGHLDPCASIEFTRGCPWDCSFCSAWTFYGRSYRIASVDAIVDDLKNIREPNAFIVDDVAFIKPDHGMAIADALGKNNIRKQYYLETRADVLLRHPEVFKRWARLGLSYMFLGIEALDQEGLKAFRKRTTPNHNFQALELARKLGIRVAINIIADPAWTPERFAHLREWAMQVPE
ncbi:MAG: cobalamin-dependent protein, partial [Phycisphaeraceae bacterium]|nr:cobalamin-dependent protein [Phycisphaeraceae bacterium]